MTIYSSIRCSVCGEQFETDDMVYLDSIYSLFHIGCAKTCVEPILGTGTFEEIGEKHPYFYKDDMNVH
ncbi:hypothetical protein [Falsibacillus albus]|uniref:Uncharacterized protein n=1 Tax=Falsibacillus albus TaxID=2478915 RepID=A0A3L7JTP0_9BACI|nr:hypothetical protein [Falsibacillus albus]RLQ93645.1 hypothetical protein D9X91_16815 [Falsibacillus albus]